MTDAPKRSTQDILDAAARASASFAHQAAPAAKAKASVTVQVAAQAHEEDQVAEIESVAVQLKIAENYFYRTLNDTSISQEDKIQQIGDALDPRKQTQDKLDENFKAFQQYYSYIQSENLDAAIEGVERMIKDLEENKNIQVAKLLTSLKGMLAEIGVSRDLVEVMRVARTTFDKEGNPMTVEKLTAALKRNDEVIAQQAALKQQRELARQNVEAADAAVAERIRLRDVAEGTFGFKFAGVFKKDTTYSDRVAAAEALKQTKVAALAAIDSDIQRLESDFNKELEEKDGIRKILRSVDETGDNLSDRLKKSGVHGIATVRAGQRSVIELMSRVIKSEDSVRDISRRVADKQVSLTILQSGLMLASEGTDEFKQVLQGQSDDVKALLPAPGDPASASSSILTVAKNKTKAIELGTALDGVVGYQGQLNNTISEMQLTLGGNVERQAKTEAGKHIIEGTKKSVTILGRDGLNKIAENMESVLSSLIADQNDEMQQVVVEFARAANEMNRGSAEAMKQRSDEMHKKDMGYLDNVVQLLKDSSTMVATTLETAVAEGIERADKQRALRLASEELEGASSLFRKVTGEMSNASVLPGRPAPASKEGTGEEPHPAG